MLCFGGSHSRLNIRILWRLYAQAIRISGNGTKSSLFSKAPQDIAKFEDQWLGQWFPTWVHQNPMEGSLKQIAHATPRVSDAAGLRICPSNNYGWCSLLVWVPNFENIHLKSWGKKRIISPCLHIFPYLINRPLQYNVIRIITHEIWHLLETQRRGDIAYA